MVKVFRHFGANTFRVILRRLPRQPVRRHLGKRYETLIDKN